MVLSELELRHFRNLGIQELRFPPEGVAVIGENAQGKTNLLEAIYYLESFRSFRGAGDGELAEFTKDVFHLKGSVAGNGRTTVAVGFDRKRRKKRVSVDGNEAIRFTRALGHLGAVVFSPADVELVNGGPRLRRRFLDIVLSLNHAGYVEALSGYRKALAQRNAALKADAGPMAARAWDGLLVDKGARVTRMRDEWVARWAETFTRYSATISGDDPLAMSYRPDLSWPRGGGSDDGGPDADAPVAGEDAIRERFHARLEENREADLRRGVTGCGPHRDDLEFTIASHPRPLPARTFGSGGQAAHGCAGPAPHRGGDHPAAARHGPDPPPRRCLRGAGRAPFGARDDPSARGRHRSGDPDRAQGVGRAIEGTFADALAYPQRGDRGVSGTAKDGTRGARFTPVSEVLEEFLAESGLGESLERLGAMDDWPDAVGSRVSGVTSAVEVRGDTLVVEVASSAWLTELSMMKGLILERLNSRRGDAPIGRIRFRLAEASN